jgi:hypothetical protein
MVGQPSIPSASLAASMVIAHMAAAPVVAFLLADTLAVEISFCQFACCELILLANR